MYYVYLIIAWILGQGLYTAVTVWRLQKGLDIAYIPALKAYIKKETGGYIVSGVFMIVVVFILPEFLNLKMDKNELLTIEQKSWAQKVQLYFRTAAVVLGMFSLHIAYSLYKRGKKEIIDADKKAGVDTEDI